MPRLLIVEDEPIIALELARQLDMAGFETVGPAVSCRQALELVAREGCDVAVLDVNLGRETSENVAAELIERGVPFVTVSAYTGEQHPKVFRAAPLLMKPVRVALLLRELRRLVGERH